MSSWLKNKLFSLTFQGFAPAGGGAGEDGVTQPHPQCMGIEEKERIIDATS